MKPGPGRAPLCPSAPARPGALLLGVVGGTGRLERFGTPIEISAEFVETAGRAGPVEARFRAASPCQTGRCVHWEEARCGLADKLVDAGASFNSTAGTGRLVACPIRAECRWWQQRGAQACAVCTIVVTDQSAD